MSTANQTAKNLHIATNTDNFKFYLECGLIVDHSWFPKNSYYNDVQENAPRNMIPCFLKKNLQEALKTAAGDADENLSICVIELDLGEKNIHYEKLLVKQLEQDYTELNSVEIKNLESYEHVLLPLPLPLHLIKAIHVANKSARDDIIREVTHFLGDSYKSKLKTNPRLCTVKSDKSKTGKNQEEQSTAELFSNKNIQSNSEKRKETATPKQETKFPATQILLPDKTKILAYGGALELCYYQTKNGKQSCALLNSIANESECDGDTRAKELMAWAKNEQDTSTTSQFNTELLNKIALESDAGIRNNSILFFLKERQSGRKDTKTLLERLQQINDKTLNDSYNEYLSKLIRHYESSSENTSKEQQISTMAILLSVAFMRDNPVTALKFNPSSFSEEHLFLVGIFYGFMYGTTQTPRQISRIQGLRLWSSAKMAQLAHESTESGIQFINTPTTPPVIYEMYKKNQTLNEARYKFLTGFCELLDLDLSSFGKLYYDAKDFAVKDGKIYVDKPFSLKLRVDIEKLEKLTREKTINHHADLFDYNAFFKLAKGQK